MSTCPKCNCTQVTIKDKGPHRGEFCSECGTWIRWVKKPVGEFVWPIGSKHKGKMIKDILQRDQEYLEWASNNLDGSLARVAKEALSKAII